MNRKSISVCMATYNGEKYIVDQLTSILSQLLEKDEVIIIDDNSSDKTYSILRKISDCRIKVYKNERNLGVNRSFEKAVELSKNEIIMMADQDDIWPINRVELILESFENNNVYLVSGNSIFIDGNSNSIEYPEIQELKEINSNDSIKNIVHIFWGKGFYYGCAMAFRKELSKIILPFPKFIESHDLWIAFAANLMKRNCHLEKTILVRRIHGLNASVIKRSIMKKIKSRIIFIFSLFVLWYRMIVKSNI